MPQVEESRATESFTDAELDFGGEKVSVNMTILPLARATIKKLGCMIMVEEISREKR